MTREEAPRHVQVSGDGAYYPGGAVESMRIWVYSEGNTNRVCQWADGWGVREASAQ